MIMGVMAAGLPSGGRMRALSPAGVGLWQGSGDLEPAHGDLAGPRIGLGVEGDLLALLQGTDACALERGGVDENVLAAVVRLNEAETFGAVVELQDRKSVV